MADTALTVQQVAQALRIRRHGVLALIKSGELRAVDVSLKPGGRPRWRVLPDDLDGFLTRRAHQPAIPRRRRRKPRSHVKDYF